MWEAVGKSDSHLSQADIGCLKFTNLVILNSGTFELRKKLNHLLKSAKVHRIFEYLGCKRWKPCIRQYSIFFRERTSLTKTDIWTLKLHITGEGCCWCLRIHVICIVSIDRTFSLRLSKMANRWGWIWLVDSRPSIKQRSDWRFSGVCRAFFECFPSLKQPSRKTQRKCRSERCFELGKRSKNARQALEKRQSERCLN